MTPGPLPFADGSFDVVFSKDAMVHIANKEALFEEIFRVLRAGGSITAGDWMSSTDGPFSATMTNYLEAEGLGFGLASPARYCSAMAQAGFCDIRMIDRIEWYRPLAHREHDLVAGPLYDQLVARVGKAFADHEIQAWRAHTVVVDRYKTFTAADGGKVFAKYENTEVAAPIYKGKWEFIGGTGKYAGIKGHGTYTYHSVTETTAWDILGEYELP